MTEHSPGPWRIGNNYGAIVADKPTDGPNGADDVEAYGGHLVCESVARRNKPLIAAAPDMLAALRRAAVALAGVTVHAPELDVMADYEIVSAAIAKATGMQDDRA